jgi:hypothetical protein
MNVSATRRCIWARYRFVSQISECWSALSAEIGSIAPLGWGYFSHDSRHLEPGYYRAVLPGQKSFTVGAFKGILKIRQSQWSAERLFDLLAALPQ